MSSLETRCLSPTRKPDGPFGSNLTAFSKDKPFFQKSNLNLLSQVEHARWVRSSETLNKILSFLRYVYITPPGSFIEKDSCSSIFSVRINSDNSRSVFFFIVVFVFDFISVNKCVI